MLVVGNGGVEACNAERYQQHFVKLEPSGIRGAVSRMMELDTMINVQDLSPS